MADVASGEFSIVDSILRLVEDNQLEIPAYPEVGMRVRQMLEQDDASAKSAAELISNDPAMSTEVLKIANSAAYGGLSEISELSSAVARLGLSQTVSIVTALSMRSQFKTACRERTMLMRALWDHAVTTALGARYLAQQVGGSSDQAFLAGLLHDTGKLLILRGLDTLREQGKEVPESRAMLDEVMLHLHPQLGHMALAAWNLPEELRRVALHHHDLVKDSEDVLMLCVQAGNLVSRKSGFHPHPDPDLTLLQEPAIEMLGMRDLSLATLMIDVEDELLEKHQLFR